MKGGSYVLMTIELVTHKIIQSGNIIELYKYEKGYLKGYDAGPRKNDSKPSEYESKEDIRERSLKRAKTTLRRLINANHGQYGKEFTSKFLTLTFGDNVTDLDESNYEFKKFIKRLNYLIFNTKKANIKYTAVWELQERGAIHYHVILYNVPYIKQNIIQDTWKNGFVWINKIKDVDNVGAYISEYLGGSEKGQNQSEFEGRKTYFNSRGLLQPLEITDKKIVETIAVALLSNKMAYSSTFVNEYLGNVSYKQYNLNNVVSQYGTEENNKILHQNLMI